MQFQGDYDLLKSIQVPGLKSLTYIDIKLGNQVSDYQQLKELKEACRVIFNTLPNLISNPTTTLGSKYYHLLLQRGKARF